LPPGTPAGFELQDNVGGFLPPKTFPTGSFPALLDLIAPLHSRSHTSAAPCHRA
jgi:hypothetical protein